MEEILSAISTVGFPIAAWVITFLYMCKSNDRHKEEVDKLSDSYQKLASVLDRLTVMLEAYGVHNGLDSKGD